MSLPSDGSEFTEVLVQCDQDPRLLMRPMKEFLIAHTAHNVRDVRATFRERYTTEALRQLPMPVLVVCGTRGPEE